MTSEDFTGRSVLVTGGGSGIGRACAEAFAAGGALVHVVDVDAESAKAVADAVGGVPHVVDLTDAAAIPALPTAVDILVNSAGTQHVAPIEEFDPGRFEKLQRLMVTAPFLLLRNCLPHMYGQGWGRVVNISSVHGLRASPFKSAYVAAKHGLEGLSKVAALEGAPHGVTSNCVNPGYVRTPLVEGQIADQAAVHGIAPRDVVSDVLLDRSAIKRLIEPAEVAEVALWLCGPHTGYVTGASLPVDGGWGAS
ncbi:MULTISPECIES: 3-hydroxybutyrate dehydrogenase [unclassified Streptomyces]|uniref:3-hydroxybutyrate dehydrogenase n=1 Tax=unclassified Streptomyces TaxID=2593676 RepID=UPI001371667F|nr:MULTISPECIES: 3-hydroxybutyrate dehydrogenase [unclassified Streptomyces]NEA06131.1 SDR family oxidoreductase [Streptomyces sp. SID10116]MYY86196.1 SDR family oxidoreductase [Streptomyces sp. SID335]MYZ19210.1 SDR family oxidoreductase [Streptomyces sp. SID337]NDZ87252.1 SDR family oxidoreductase [Streptomyces sp. SID10115]NEB48659.1 SDR family oxidoreductase [Streptomyces sp. SID339]